MMKNDTNDLENNIGVANRSQKVISLVYIGLFMTKLTDDSVNLEITCL